MMLSQKLEKLTENWPAKILCLVAAIFICVFHHISTQETRSIAIPLQVIADGKMVPVNSIPKIIKITVKGRPADIKQIEADDFSAYVNIGYYTESGMHMVPVEIELSDTVSVMEDLEVTAKPHEIELNLEKLVTDYVPAVPLIKDEPAYGYKCEEVVIEPELIQISGPESIVKAETGINTTIIELNSKNSSFEKTVSLINKNKYIQVEPEEVKVKVHIEPIVQERILRSIPVSFINLSENLKIKDGTKSVNMIISGEMVTVEKYLVPLNAVYIDCGDITGTGDFTLPVKTSVQKKISVVSVEPKEFSFSVEEKKTEETVSVSDEPSSSGALENISGTKEQ